MGVGSILVGIALALVVGAYLARPFRSARAGLELDRTIEAWVAQVRGGGGVEEAAGYCPPCGTRRRPGEVFCARCGRRLPGGGE